MRPVTNYPDTMPKASGCLRHVTKNDRKLYRWRCAFRLLLWFRIEEQRSVKQDTALASKKPFPIMAASGTLFSCCHEKTKTLLWLSSTPSWFSDPLLKWWEGSAARSVVGCFLLISFDHRANHSQFI